MSERTYRKIIIADDHTLFRNGLKILLNNLKDYRVVAEASNGKEFLDVLETIQPDLVLLDIEMPVMDGIEAAEIALRKFPALKIITLSMYGEEDYYYQMVNAGVKGFVLKNSDIKEVKAALETVFDGGSYFSSELLENLVNNLKTIKKDKESHTELSEREMEILVLICQGYSNQEIADQLFISKRTVDKHRANILEKSESKNTAQLVVYAIKNRLVEL
ncbi:MAG: DNA-binding response regulator [Bacteroidetes bacterium GWF2_42_66]|nr:MAG: DNA-binding response regulator [Bacteroidetes bacterium GWA2_42_15]OFY02577.1 MAG: DNA-binding response regulator [Bacteroidetes bacterium GWE2_42_39]OFY41323.1 MAG: DNA-binding response regulator [Bacteroidetes bacterium GWF2_42_66]HAZ04949.1 DNA-binding response regulator [Marinilabiliales bacterium]HBL75480.1 DNA-binding response regulator [Prolixibacteraceae bacterium]